MAVEIGVALPQYAYGAPLIGGGELLAWAARAEQAGFDSVWLADHLFMTIEKYGGRPGRHPGVDPLVALGAVARATTSVRFGPLVLNVPLRAPALAAKALASLDRLGQGRLIAGLGAGWLAEEFAVAGVPFEPPGRRLAQLSDAIDVLRGMWGPEPFTYRSATVSVSGARAAPGPVQPGGPPIWVGGSGDRLLALVAERADGWNTVWRMTPERYRERIAVLAAACEAVGRDPATVTRSLGLAALVGENESDLRARWRQLQRDAPPGVIDGVSLDEWRAERLVGTPEQIREQAAGWAEMGVAHLIVGFGALPFGAARLDQLEAVADCLGLARP